MTSLREKLSFLKVWLKNIFWSPFGFDRYLLDFSSFQPEKINNQTNQPKISIIIVTYNNLILTKNCLNSIFCFSHYSNLEIIIVDNGSADETKKYLQQVTASNPQIRLILNDHNRGFAPANNQGLKIASGEYIVFLNNDTIVTPHWLPNLLRHFQQDQAIGLLGPVTNNIGNSAKIKVDYHNLIGLLDFSARHRQKNINQKKELPSVALFCAIAKKTTLERIGGLSEEYKLGYFEDDDLCQRIKQQSLKIFCAQDVFIHHVGGASFGRLPWKKRMEIFNQNKKIYEKKWGQWTKP